MTEVESKKYMKWKNMSKKDKWKTIIGWSAVGITLVISSFWAFWGIVENFHEGWYSTSVWENLFMLFFQYIGFPIVFIVLSLIALKWRWVGFGIFTAVAIFVVIFFGGANFSVVYLMLAIPLISMGLLYLFGKVQPKFEKYAILAIILIPTLVIGIGAIPGAIRVSQRIDDGNCGMRTVVGNGITLIWAPEGPGWPTDEKGYNWTIAVNQTRYLNEDGLTLNSTIQDIWRLPSVEEMVRSQQIHGESAGGTWDTIFEKATYEKTPDKETPLWKPHSLVIYYWTGTEISGTHAYIIVYDGGVFVRDKQYGYPYLNFRAVTEP